MSNFARRAIHAKTIADVEVARELAEKRGLPYQTYIKGLARWNATGRPDSEKSKEISSFLLPLTSLKLPTSLPIRAIR